MSKSLKRKIENSYEEKYGNPDIDINDIKSRLMFKTQEKRKGESIMSANKQKKSHLVTWLVLSCLVVAIALVIIFVPGNGSKGKEGAYKDQVTTISVNPSVSFATDEKGLVISAYGENDEGKMLLEGEEFQGLTLEVAMDKLFDLEVKCGYIVKSDDPKYNNIEIKISAEASPELEEKVNQLKGEAVASLKELGVEVENKITTIKEDGHKALVDKLVSLDKTMTAEEADKLSDDKILALIGAYYLETSKFPTKELEALYNNFKYNEIKIADTEAITKIEGGLLTLNATIQTAYNTIKDNVKSALADLEQAYADNFVKADCAYQKAYAKVKEVKAEVLKLTAEANSMEDGINKTAILAQLKVQEGLLETAKQALEGAQTVALGIINGLNTVVNTTFEKLDNYIVATPDLKNLMDSKTKELEDYVNTAKDNMFENFENKYKADIENFAGQVKTQKQNLIDSLKEYAK